MLFGSINVTQMVIIMVYVWLLAVTNLNRLISIINVVSDYGWIKTNMILSITLQICESNDTLFAWASPSPCMIASSPSQTLSSLSQTCGNVPLLSLLRHPPLPLPGYMCRWTSQRTHVVDRFCWPFLPCASTWQLCWHVHATWLSNREEGPIIAKKKTGCTCATHYSATLVLL